MTRKCVVVSNLRAQQVTAQRVRRAGTEREIPATIRKGAMVTIVLVNSEGKVSRYIILFVNNGIFKRVHMGTGATDGMYVGRVRKLGK